MERMRYKKRSVRPISPACSPNFTAAFPPIPLATLPPIPMGWFQLQATLQVQVQLQPLRITQPCNVPQQTPRLSISADTTEVLANLVLEYPKEVAVAVGLSIAAILCVCWFGSQN